MRNTRNFWSLDGIKDYFIGDLLKIEGDSLKSANVIMVFYVSISALILLIFLQVMYFIAGADLVQKTVGFSSILVFSGGLFYIKWRKSTVLLTDIIFLYSAGVTAMNLWLYPGMSLVNGLHLAANLLFAFHVLSKWKAVLGVAFFLLVVIANIFTTNAGIELPFITPIQQPILEQIVSFITLLGITLLLIVHYKTTHRKAAEKLTHSLRELMEAKAAAEDMSRLKSTFLANMSHEIRTPLNGVLGINEILKDQISDQDMQEYLDIQYQSGQRLLHTIDSILRLSKLEASQNVFKLNRVRLSVVVNEVIENQKAIAHNENLSLQLIETTKNVEALVDEGMMYQVISNLVGNAIKFTNTGGKIEVTIGLTEDGLSAFISVKDSGVGISKDFLTKLFEPFEQESAGQSRKFQGSGLGLSISKKFIELMGGSIKVESEKGVGSEFSILLPAYNTPLGQ